LRVIVKLPFGRDTRAVDLRGLRVRPLSPSAPAGARDPAAVVRRALDGPVAGPPLTELAERRRTAVVVVPDATRKVDLPLILPEVFKRLVRGGVEPERTSVVVACGTHPPAPSESLRALVGQLPSGVDLVQHDARDDRNLAEIGRVAGRAIRINRRVADAEVLVTIGDVRHHYFAGFGGGPKMIFPGVAGYEEIQSNHGLVIDDPGGDVIRHPLCEPGVLEGNPVFEEIADAADLRPPDMAICLVPGKGGGFARIVAGPWRTAFELAVAKVREWYEVPMRERCALAVASGGGPPSDSTLIQGHKGLDAACRFVADGGEVLYIADLGSGAGSLEMEPFLADPDRSRILRQLADQWVQYGHTTLRILEKTERVRVHLVSNLDFELAERLGFVPADDPGEVVESWRRNRGGETVAVFPGAPVYPRVGEG
jgi:nickel-dependent lactate racemase